MSEFKKNDYHTITFNTLSIRRNDIKNILNDIEQSSENNILIDMTGVRNCCNNFYRMFAKTNKNIALINTDSEILATLYMMNFDKYIKIYNEKISYLTQKNELLNKHLKVVN